MRTALEILDHIEGLMWKALHDEFKSELNNLRAAIARETVKMITRDEFDAMEAAAELSRQAIAMARDKALEDCKTFKPRTAEDPDKSAYNRGHFDAIMEYHRTIHAMIGQPERFRQCIAEARDKALEEAAAQSDKQQCFSVATEIRAMKGSSQ